MYLEIFEIVSEQYVGSPGPLLRNSPSKSVITDHMTSCDPLLTFHVIVKVVVPGYHGDMTATTQQTSYLIIFNTTINGYYARTTSFVVYSWLLCANDIRWGINDIQWRW